jgi:hypothetical protein
MGARRTCIHSELENLLPQHRENPVEHGREIAVADPRRLLSMTRTDFFHNIITGFQGTYVSN